MMGSLAVALWAACPDCPPVRDARALFFEDGFFMNLAFALAPFAITLGVVAWLVSSISRRARKGMGDAQDG